MGNLSHKARKHVDKKKKDVHDKFQWIDHHVSNNKLVYWFPIYLQAANKMPFHIHWNLDNIWINHVKLKNYNW